MIKELEDIISLQEEIDKLEKEQIELKQKIYNIEHSKEYNKLIEVSGDKIILEQKIKTYYDNFNKIVSKLNKICIPSSLLIAIGAVILLFKNFIFISLLFALTGMGLTYVIFKKSTQQEEKKIENLDIKKLEEEKETLDKEYSYQQSINKTIKRKLYKCNDLYNLRKEKIEVLKNKKNTIINNIKTKSLKKGINEIINNDKYSNINAKVKKYSLNN